MTLYYRYIVTKGLSRTVSETAISVENRKFSHPPPVYLTPPLKEFPLESGIGARGQKLEWWGYQMVQTFKIDLAV